MDRLRVFEAFAGYGSQAMALRRLKDEYSQFDFEVVGISEIDKYAIQAYMAVHGDTKNYGDISKINWNDVPNFDLFTYSFPCQDISTAGFQKGFVEGSGTRSSLLWECKKAIESKKPKYLLMENVKALCSKKFLPYLHKWMSYLDGLGYSNYAKVLNAKDYGVPQNRERLFMVSILGECKYEFPFPFELKLRLKDVLENNVDESDYIEKNICILDSDTQIRKAKVYSLLNVNPSGNGINGNVFDTDGICPTLTTNKGEGYKILSYTRDNKGKVVDRHFKDVCNTIHTSTGSGGNTDCFVAEHKNTLGFRIRKLTSRECFRLMGVSDSDIDKIQSAGISKTQRYKMAGNSIVVDVLYHIFRKIFIDKKQENEQLKLF